MHHKILFISSWYPNNLELSNGNFVQRHAEAVSMYHNVEVLHAIGDFKQNENFLFDDKVINGIRTLVVYYKNTKNPVINFYRRMNAYQKGYQKMQKPDLVHANVLHNNMFFAVWLKKKYGIPFVLSEHWTAFLENADDAHNEIWRYFAKRIANNASYIMPVSEKLLEGLKILGVKTPMETVSNVVDLDLFDVKPIHHKNFTFIHISNLVERKNPYKIIDAFLRLRKENDNINLKIGGTDNLEQVKAYLEGKEHSESVEVFGYLSHAELVEKINASDALVLFSDNETQGCVALEAMACGVPTIASSVGGVPQYVKDFGGILVEKGNIQQLYDEMKNMVEGVKTFDKQAMRQFAINTYGKEAVAKRISEIYNKVLNEKIS